MRALALPVLLAAGTLSAQIAPVASPQAALNIALVGHWTGVLEYRDYSEPPTSSKRVQLPTWLVITAAPQGVSLDYIYDDGPAKLVRSHNTLLLDLAANRYTVLSTDSPAESYTIANLDQLKDGRGTLILTGPGTDNKQPAEIRTTWTIRRNLLVWLEEVRPAGSSEPFTFRHRYTFTRADPPSTPPPSPK